MEDCMMFSDNIFPLEEDDLMSKLVEAPELQTNSNMLLQNVLQQIHQQQQQQKQERRFFPSDCAFQFEKLDNDIDRLFDEYYEPKTALLQQRRQLQSPRPESPVPPPLPPLTPSFSSNNETTLTPRFSQVSVQTPKTSMQTQKIIRPKLIKTPTSQCGQLSLQRLSDATSIPPPSLLQSKPQCPPTTSTSVSPRPPPVQTPTSSQLQRNQPPVPLVILSTPPASLDDEKFDFGNDSDESRMGDSSNSEDSPTSSSFDKARNADRRRIAKEKIRKRKAGISDSPSIQKPESKDDAQCSKKHQRLLRNRVSAQLSRERKKSYVTQLEAQLKSLMESNENLSSQVKTLNSENLDLKRKITLASDQSSPSPPLGVSTSVNCKQQLQTPSNALSSDCHKSELQTYVMVVGMVLLVSMFHSELGLFSNA